MSEKRGGSKGDQGYWIKYTVDIAENRIIAANAGGVIITLIGM